MRFVVFFLVFFLVVGCFGSLVVVFGQGDTSVLSMSGSGWSLKVDSGLQTSLESKNQPYVSVLKSGSEKELFLSLNSSKDCVSGVVEFKVQTQGLSVYKQLPLDKELNVTEYDFVNATVAMKKDKVVVSRPENVVNSFACFDSQGKKVMHIYASKLIDAKGNNVWVDSDLKYGLFTVYLDQKFLDGAVFPVVVDPSFGYTSIGVTEVAQYGTWQTGCNFSLAEKSYVNSVTAYMKAYSTPSLARFAVFNMTTIPTTKIEESGNVTVGSEVGWVSGNLGGSIVYDAGQYALAAVVNYTTYIYYDDVVNDNLWISGMDSFVFVSPFSLDITHTWVQSIYANYTSYVAPTPTPTPSPSPSPVSSVTPVPIDSDYVNGLVGFALMSFLLCFNLVSLVWFRRVPLVVYLVGFFTFVVGVAVATSGFIGSEFGHYYVLFVVVMAGICMLLVGLGVRVGGRR